MSIPTDKLKREIKLGDRVARAYRSGTHAHMEIGTVTNIGPDWISMENSRGRITNLHNVLVVNGVE